MTNAITTLGADYDLPSLFRLANALLQAQGIIPPNFKKEGEIVAVVLTGRELGIAPMTALRGIQLVKGRVVLDASLQLGLMVRQGCTFEWLTDSSDGQVASLRIQRAGQKPYVSTFTIEMAQKAGLANGDNWRKYPAAMLRARAVSAAGKAYMPDVMAGLYVPGELEDDPEHPDRAPQRATDIHVEQPKSLSADAPRGHALPEETESARIVRELYAVQSAADLARLREDANVARKRLAPDEKEAIRKGIEWAAGQVQKLAQEQLEAKKRADEEALTSDGDPSDRAPAQSADLPEPGANDEPDAADFIPPQSSEPAFSVGQDERAP